MSWFDCVPLAGELRSRNVHPRDVGIAVSWWLFSKPGEAMMLVGGRHPHLRIDHEGNVTEVAPPIPTRTDHAVEWFDKHERFET